METTIIIKEKKFVFEKPKIGPGRLGSAAVEKLTYHLGWKIVGKH